MLSLSNGAFCGRLFESYQNVCCHWMNVNSSMKMGSSQLFLLWTYLPVREKSKMGYVLKATESKAKCPFPLRSHSTARCVLTELMSICQVNLICWTWHVVVEVWLHRGSIKMATLPVLVNALMNARKRFIFIDKELLGLYRKALSRHQKRGLSLSQCVYLSFSCAIA